MKLKLLLIAALLVVAASWAGAQPPDAGVAAEPEAEAARPAQAQTTETRFELGRHYNRLSPTQPTSSGPEQIEVAELFWYGCPYCNAFQPFLQQWRQGMPGYVSFVRIPAVWNPLARLHARAFYTAQELGRLDELHTELFGAIHTEGNALDTEEALQQFFARFGVGADEFRAAFDSVAVHSRLQRAEELARRYRITGVPAVVINGKYTADANAAGGYEELIELIEVLAAREAARED